MRPDQERVRNVLVDSIVIMCQKGLNFNCELKLQGVIGITVDYEESFVIHINQTIEAASNGNTTISPSRVIKQEPQQTFSGYDNQSQVGAATPIKKEPSQNFYASPPGIKVEPRQQMSHFSPPRGPPNQFSQRVQSPPMNLQMALVPVAKNPQRMMRPRGRGAARGNAAPRQMMPRGVRPQQVRQALTFGPSFGPPNVMQQHRPPRMAQQPPTRPKKAPQQRQRYSSQGEQEDAYDDEGYDAYGQPQQSTKRTRGGGAKKARGGMAPFAGQVSQSSSDRSFKLVSRYICDIDGCSASFTMKSNLRRHQKSKHSEYNLGDDDDEEGMGEFDDEGGREYY